MSYSMITLVGNVGRDPEMRYTPTGAAVADFSVAVNRKYKTNDGESRDETDWFKITAWQKRAEFVNQYVERGAKIFVTGWFSMREYKRRDGAMGVSLEVSAQHIELMSGGGAREETAPKPAASANQDPDEVDIDDLPW